MKQLGKISCAEFGTISDYPFLMGLILTFTMPGSGIGDGGQHTINMSKDCKWNSIAKRNECAFEILSYVHKLLHDAKVDSVEQLVGIPVEIEIEGNVFKDFRILTEVL